MIIASGDRCASTSLRLCAARERCAVNRMILASGNRSRTDSVSRLDITHLAPRQDSPAQIFARSTRLGNSNVFAVYLLNFAVGSFSVSGRVNIGRYGGSR